MAKPTPLPDPSWSLAVCLRCGYPLEGLAREGNCPECGRAYRQGMLLLHGVPRRKSSSAARRLVWFVLAIVAFVFVELLAVTVSLLPVWVGLGGTVFLVGAFLVMLATSRRERTGPERFLVGESGIESFPLRPSPSGVEGDVVLHPWGDSNAVELQRISAVWRRLRVGRWAGWRGQVRDPVFDAGVRCPDQAAASVKSEIEAFLKRADPESAAGS